MVIIIVIMESFFSFFYIHDWHNNSDGGVRKCLQIITVNTVGFLQWCPFASSFVFKHFHNSSKCICLQFHANANKRKTTTWKQFILVRETNCEVSVFSHAVFFLRFGQVISPRFKWAMLFVLWFRYGWMNKTEKYWHPLKLWFYVVILKHQPPSQTELYKV